MYAPDIGTFLANYCTPGSCTWGIQMVVGEFQRRTLVFLIYGGSPLILDRSPEAADPHGKGTAENLISPPKNPFF